MKNLPPAGKSFAPFTWTMNLWGQLRSGEMSEWPSADRSLFISVVVFVLYLYAAGLATYLARYSELPAFFDPVGVDLLATVSYLTVSAWGLLVLASLIGHRRLSDSGWFVVLPIQFYAFNSAFFSYLLGPVTTPFFPFALLGGMLVSAPLFGRPATFWGAGTMISLVVGASLAEQWGLIPYAPLLRSYPVEDGALSIIWLIGLGSFEVIALGLTLMLAVLLFDELRQREHRLLRTNENLVETQGELERLAGELRSARDQLETRVEQRTRAADQANRDRRQEAQRADRADRDLQTLTAAMEEAVEGIAEVGADGRFQSVNAAFAAMHHAQVGRMVGTLADDWVQADDRGRLESASRRVQEGEKIELEVFGRAIDERRFNQRLVLVRKEAEREFVHYRFASDVSTQRALREKMTQAGKMDAMGRLAGGIAHEFNNLLTAILSSSEELKDQLEAGRKSEELDVSLNWITTSARRAAELTGGLLAFSHSHPAAASSFDLGLSVHAIIQMLERTLGSPIELESEVPEEPLPVCVDRARFESSLMNLAINARDSMPQGGALRFAVRLLRVEERDPRFAAFALAPGRFVNVEVADTGAGIPAEDLPNIFDPFFTTKEVGQGTGLGLSLVYNFVRESGGAIDVNSRPGVGTAISILLPLSSEVKQDLGAKMSKSSSSGTETILIAEDEPIVANVLTRILSSRGYRVIACLDGGEAVESFRKHRDEVDLVLVDLRMPVLSGVEVFDRVHEIAPQTPVVLMSGNTLGSEVEGLRARGLRAVVPKPYRRSELLEVVRRVLDERALLHH